MGSLEATWGVSHRERGKQAGSVTAKRMLPGEHTRAALIMVLIPSESVRQEFAATAIALTTFVGELVGATVAPWESGRLAQSHGLEITLWIAGAGMMLVLLLSTAMKETGTAVRGESVRLGRVSLAI